MKSQKYFQLNNLKLHISLTINTLTYTFNYLLSKFNDKSFFTITYSYYLIILNKF